MIAQRANRVAQVVQTTKYVGILRLGFDVQLGRRVQRDGRPEITNSDGDRFTKKAVRRVAEQARPGVGTGFDEQGTG